MTEFDRAGRLAALRGLLDAHGLDAMLVSRAANKRYFSGFRTMDDEESSWPGTLFVTREDTLILADSRYTEQAEIEAPGWDVVLTTGGIAQDLPPILSAHDVVALGMEAQIVTHAEWSGLAEAAPGVELHAMDEEIAPFRLRKAADDGTVEAVEDTARRFMLGVLWHPEEDEADRLIGAFVEECRAGVPRGEAP